MLQLNTALTSYPYMNNLTFIEKPIQKHQRKSTFPSKVFKRKLYFMDS